jgi:lysozyme
MNNPTTSAKGRAFIKGYEKLRLIAYPDPGTGGAPYTLGWGQTGPNIKKGSTCTKEEADAWFDAHVAKCEAAIAKYITVPLNQNQFDALVSWLYNCGEDIARTSTLTKKLNLGDFLGASQEFPRWNHSGGHILDGLTTRREAEQMVFLTPVK